MGLIKDSHRKCENCDGQEATKALVIPGKLNITFVMSAGSLSLRKMD